MRLSMLSAVLVLGASCTLASCQHQPGDSSAPSDKVTISYDSSIPAGKYDVLEGPGTVIVRVPMRIAGVPKGEVIHSDRLDFRLIDQEGQVLYRTTVGVYSGGKGNQDGVSQLEWRHDDNRDIRTHASFSIPPGVYRAFRDKPVSIKLTYTITLFQPSANGTIGLAEGSKAAIPELGRCESLKTSDDQMMEVQCFDRGMPRHCLSVFAENTRTKARNSAILECQWFRGFPSLSDYSTIPFSLPYILGRAPRYIQQPVDITQLADARLVIKTYQPIATFEREVTSPPLLIASLRDPRPVTAATSSAPATITPDFAQQGSETSRDGFAIRVVDEIGLTGTPNDPANDYRVPIADPIDEMPRALWLKREGKIGSNAVEDAKAIVQDGEAKIEFHLTASGRDQFAAMTRTNLGRRIAIIVAGQIVASPVVMTPIEGGAGYISDFFANEAEAQAMAIEIIRASHPGK